MQRQEDVTDTQAEFERAVEILEKQGDEQELTKALNHLGSVKQRQGDVAGAQAVFERAVEILEKQDDARGLAIVLNNLGNLLIQSKQLDEAIEVLERAEATVPRQDTRTRSSIQARLRAARRRAAEPPPAWTQCKIKRLIEKSLTDRFGFAARPGEPDVFFHVTYIGHDTYDSLEEGMFVEIDITHGPDGRPRARAVRLVSEP